LEILAIRALERGKLRQQSNVVAIGQTFAEICRFFPFFQYGGFPPSWICDARVWTTYEGHLVVFLSLCKIWLESMQ